MAAPRKNVTTGALAVKILLLGLAPLGARADDAPPTRFDGIWDTIVSCQNASGAYGYSFEFPSTVKQGVLHGEKGTPGEPGWLRVPADVQASGVSGLSCHRSSRSWDRSSQACASWRPSSINASVNSGANSRKLSSVACAAAEAPAVASFYPLAEFSPEWRAIRWALARRRPASD